MSDIVSDTQAALNGQPTGQTATASTNGLVAQMPPQSPTAEAQQTLFDTFNAARLGQAAIEQAAVARASRLDPNNPMFQLPSINRTINIFPQAPAQQPAAATPAAPPAVTPANPTPAPAGGLSGLAKAGIVAAALAGTGGAAYGLYQYFNPPAPVTTPGTNMDSSVDMTITPPGQN